MTSFSDPEGLLPFSEPPLGALIRSEFVFDDSTNPTPSQLPTLQDYPFAGVQTTFQFGGTTLDDSDFDSNLVSVGNPTFFDEDAWTYLAFIPTEPEPCPGPGTCPSLRFVGVLVLIDTTKTVLDSTELAPPPWPARWTTAEVGFQVFRTEFGGPEGTTTTSVASALANVTSLTVTVVPIPAAVWLFGSALGLLGYVRSRRPS